MKAPSENWPPNRTDLFGAWCKFGAAACEVLKTNVFDAWELAELMGLQAESYKSPRDQEMLEASLSALNAQQRVALDCLIESRDTNDPRIREIIQGITTRSLAKKMHCLRPGLRRRHPSWPGQRVTVCGIFLYQTRTQSERQAMFSKWFGAPANIEIRAREEYDNCRAPKQDPGAPYTVYLRTGWDDSPLWIAKEGIAPTCKRCQASLYAKGAK